MYRAGDQVVYGTHGVCRITQEEKRIVDRKMVTYLVLEPVGQPGSRYLVPTHNGPAMAKLRPMLSREEMQALLTGDTVRCENWIPEENLRRQYYRELIGSGDRERLLRMTYTLYRHRERQTEAGKKCHMSDENFLRDLEKLLASEISQVMDIDAAQAKVLLRESLK